ncbi:uncharacterized protein LOC120326691 [Styela clava]
MDDCNLEKLSVAPAKLLPKFNRKVLEYSSTVPSNVEKVKVDCLTSDSGASYQIIGSGGEKVIPLIEGTINEIKIEVTAEDGTIQNYVLSIKRLSASDAILSTLALSEGVLEPQFSLDETEYLCKVPCTAEQVIVKATAPDKQCEILVDGQPVDTPVILNVGETKTIVSVKSVDGKNTKDYVISVVRKQLLWPMFIKDKKTALKYECPMTLSPLYCPVSINGSEPKAVISQHCMDMFTRRSKVNPLDETNLEPDWRCIEYDIDKDITGCLALSLYSHKGCKDEISLGKMADHAIKSEHKPKSELDQAVVTGSDWYKAEFEGSSASSASGVKHTVQVRNWEKRLQHMAADSNVDKLIRSAETYIKKYRQALPKKMGDIMRYANGESPVDYLHQASVCYAAAIKGKFKDANLHLRLGFVLEEQYYLQEMYGLEKKEEDEAAGTDMAAKESSKEDDIQAICKMKGVGPGAPLSLQLKAIDDEYHSLLDRGLSSKADYVMALYSWKSKQAVKGGQTAQNASDDSNPLGQAYLKYLDALATNPNDHTYNLHVGRMMLAQENHKEAIPRLQQAVGLKPTSVIGRFYLGLTLLTQEGGPGPREKEALGYMHDGLEHLMLLRLEEASAKATSNTNLGCEDPWNIFNIQILRGMYIFAQYLEKNPQTGFCTAKEIYHCICLHASVALTTFHARNDIFKQLEWLVLDCHYSLLELLMKEPAASIDEELISKRCNYLSALIRNVTIPQNDDLLQLQEKVCQKLVTIQPCSSRSLYLLGVSQLARYDNDPKSEFGERSLKDCRLSFHSSISLEGKPASGNAPDEISNQKWWQDRIAAEKAKNKPAEKTTPAGAAVGGPWGRGAPRGQARGVPARGRAAPARGAPAARGTPAARGRAGATAPARGARGGRGGVTTPTAASSNTKCDKPAPAKNAEESKPASPTSTVNKSDKPASINRVTHHARLGLARALTRTEDTIKDAKDKYEEVIKMAPEVHDAYIELAEILMKTDPLSAVDVYCRFPKSGEEGSFDDAYLSGEIVHILMKHEKFDDDRLCEHMVAWGRVMGIGVLDKYMEVLNNKFKTKLLKSVYAGVHRKSIDDPDLEAFFRFKCWI